MWKPELKLQDGSIYKTLADALQGDIERGVLRGGERLPTHRDLARVLGVTVGTVTRAYQEAARRGLVGGEVGRGTFVRAPGLGRGPFELGRRDEEGLIDLSLNFPVQAGVGRKELSDLLRDLAAREDLIEFSEYQQQNGHPASREAGARWLTELGAPVDPERVLVTEGVQHGMAIAFSTLAQPGEVVLTESLTYPGMKALASLLHLRLHGLEMDEQGVLPEAIEPAVRATGARLLYLTPTLHNPATCVLPAERRERIVEIARALDLTILEDDSYGFLVEDSPPTLVSLAPETTIYAASTSKSLTPGLRVGYLAVPERHVERMISSLWAISWMTSPLMAEAAAMWIRDGTAARLMESKRREARQRQVLAQDLLAGHRIDSQPASYHLWLHLPEPFRGEDFVAQAQRRGVAVTPAETFVAGRGEAPHCVRVCLGSVHETSTLEQGLRILADVLQGQPECARPFV